jgi:hypothetical protein
VLAKLAAASLHLHAGVGFPELHLTISSGEEVGLRLLLHGRTKQHTHMRLKPESDRFTVRIATSLGKGSYELELGVGGTKELLTRRIVLPARPRSARRRGAGSRVYRVVGSLPWRRVSLVSRSHP